MNSELFFYNHEWTKHGTCWNATMDQSLEDERQISYFETVLNLSKAYDIYNHFNILGIKPSEEPQSLENITTALDTLWGNGSYQLICMRKDHVEYLSDVVLCLDLQHNLTKCPYLSYPE